MSKAKNLLNEMQGSPVDVIGAATKLIAMQAKKADLSRKDFDSIINLTDKIEDISNQYRKDKTKIIKYRWS